MNNSITQGFFSKLGYKDEKQNIAWPEWIMIGLIFAFCFLSFHYVDMDSILDNTVLFVHSITEGQFFDFYKYSMEHASTNWSANYELPVYVLFAIWNLPTIVLGYFIPITYTKNVFTILWAKLLIVVFIVLSALVVVKIAKSIGLDKQRAIFIAFLFCSSTNLIVFTNVIPQIEIIPIFFMLLGMYYYLNDRTKAFLICFAVAIPLKMFAIFVFIPLLLLKYKKVLKVIGCLICGMSIQLLCKLIFINSAEYHYATGSNTDSIIKRLTTGNFRGANAEIPLFLVALIGVCIVAYVLKPKDKNELAKYTFYLPFVIFASMFIFFSPNTYWIVMLVPFMIMTIALNPKFLKLNLFLEMGTGLGYVFHCFCYSVSLEIAPQFFKHLLLDRLFPVGENEVRQYSSAKALMKSTGLVDFDNFFFALFVVCLVAMIIINFPRKSVKEIGNVEKIEYSVIWARFAVTLIVVGTVAFSYVKTMPNAIIDTTKTEWAVSSYSVASEDTILSQSFTVNKDMKASSITLRFENRASDRKNMGNVTFTLKNSSGAVIKQHTEGTSEIKSNKGDYILKLNVRLKANEKYTLEITGTKHNNKNPTNIVMAKENDILPKAYVNGKIQDGCLYMKLR